MDIIAQIEVNIDYPEYEDVEQLTTNDLLPKTNEWLTKIDRILARVQTGQMLKKVLIPLLWVSQMLVNPNLIKRTS